MERYTNGAYHISTDKSLLQLAVLYNYLSNEAYWSKGIPLETIEKAIQNSTCFGLYKGTEQIGFARVITDHATFAYLADVFILNDYRGEGLAKWLVQVVVECPIFNGLRRWMLITKDAQGLYQEYGGFNIVHHPEQFMEKSFPNIYR